MQQTFPEPRCVVKSELINRPDQDSNITCSEYLDEPDVLLAKVRLVADVLKQSNHAICYSGAGLSRASGINDYSSRGQSIVKSNVFVQSPMDALPNFSHTSLAKLHKRGIIKDFVNQNQH